VKKKWYEKDFSKKTSKSNRRPRTGQAIVELALVFPFFLLIVLGGIIDFGFAFNNLITLQQISSDAARFAAEGNGGTGVPEQKVRDFIFSRKPPWWGGNFVISPMEVKPLQNGEVKIIKVFLTYESPVYTPFYAIMVKVASGMTSINLSVVSAYQIPKNT